MTVRLLWIRRDLRLDDNPALAAAGAGKTMVPVYILEESLGLAPRWWAFMGLEALRRRLIGSGSGLLFRRGDPALALAELASQTGATEVHWNARLDLWGSGRDARVKAALESQGLRVVVAAPNALETSTEAGVVAEPVELGALSLPLAPLPDGMRSEVVELLGIRMPAQSLAAGWSSAWRPGEARALARLEDFMRDRVDTYDVRAGDLGAEFALARLSPHLAWGEVSLRRVWAASLEHKSAGARAFRRALLRREAALASAADPSVWAEALEKAEGDADFVAWCSGCTGMPLADAAMRHLAHAGWAPDLARRAAADAALRMGIDWRACAGWMMERCVDAEGWVLALNWQQCLNADTFDPAAHDPDSIYIRRWAD